VSLVVTVTFLRFWQPRTIWRFATDDVRSAECGVRSAKEKAVGSRLEIADDTLPPMLHSIPSTSHSALRTPQLVKAWLPFLILTVFVLLWGLPVIKNAMNRATTPAIERGGWDVPLLHKAVTRAAPVVAEPAPEAAKYDFNWLSMTGTGCFLAAILSG